MKAKPCLTKLLLALAISLQLQAASTIKFGASSYTVAENAGSVCLAVLRAGDTDTVVSVDFATADGTATNGLKYTAVSGTLPFGAGETNKTIVVPILNEGFVEGTKRFTVTLSNPTNAVVETPTVATVSITDNDTGLQFECGPFTFGSYQVAEDAGFILIGVTRGDDGDFPVTVDVTTTDMTTAKAGMDYTGVTNTLFFAAGEKVQTFTIPILNDGIKEASETFRLTLNNPTNQVLGAQKTATVTILDNDPGVQFTQPQAQSGFWVYQNKGAIVLNVTRGNDGLLDSFTVDYTTTNGTAIAGRDYAETKGTLTFGGGEMIQSFSVPILDDGVARTDRHFKVRLSNPTGGMVLGAVANVTATVTICDNREMLPHRFDAVEVAANGIVSLTLGGGYTLGLGVVNRFQPYFDLYPIDVSTNLEKWAPLVMLQRTNASTNVLTFQDTATSSYDRRFYRMPTNWVISPCLMPTGPYTVGVTKRLLTDPSRRNRYGVSTNGSFMITIWYPGIPEPGKLPELSDDPVTGRGRYVHRPRPFLSRERLPEPEARRGPGSISSGAVLPWVRRLALDYHGNG